jgi:hypothetical protein
MVVEGNFSNPFFRPVLLGELAVRAMFTCHEDLV